ncbi:MAG: hypothetical protein WCC64_11980 [Aliidongia sp.]
MRTVSLLEHEAASVGNPPGEKRFTLAEVEAVGRAQTLIGVEALRWTGRNRVKATHHVGMVVAPEIRLEVLPKIDGLGLRGTRDALVRMICTAWDVPIYDGEITGHASQDHDLLELLIGVFARRLQAETRRGLSRTYCRREDDLSRLRGKLDVTRQFTRLAASPQKLACRYDEFTADTSLNRLLLCAAQFLRRRSMRADTQRLLSEIVAHFENVETVSAAEALMGDGRIDRANRRWDVPARLARLLLSAIYQTTHGGRQDGVALLFDMNLLFEAFIAAIVRKALAPLGYEIRTQKPQRCLATDRAGRGAFHMKPDLHVERDGWITVLDTKWKHLDPARPNFDIAQSDAYQMHGYAQVYGARSTILLFPHHHTIAEEPGLQAHWYFESGGSVLGLATVDVANTSGFAVMLRGLLEDR